MAFTGASVTLSRVAGSLGTPAAALGPLPITPLGRCIAGLGAA